jgi:hypothetical protein
MSLTVVCGRGFQNCLSPWMARAKRHRDVPKERVLEAPPTNGQPQNQSPPNRPSISQRRPFVVQPVYGCLPICVYMCLPAMMTRRTTTDKAWCPDWLICRPTERLKASRARRGSEGLVVPNRAGATPLSKPSGAPEGRAAGHSGSALPALDVEPPHRRTGALTRTASGTQ